MKKLVIMVGISGSGKSTRAKEIAAKATAENLTSGIFSTDNYFVHEGKYLFQPSRLGQFHKMNQAAVAEAMKYGMNCVIVDNTNLTKWERKTYSDIADSAGYTTEVVVVGGFSPADCQIYAARNAHGVPLTSILKMAQRYQEP